MRDELYSLPENFHIFENCGKCLCAMCKYFYLSACRACPFCYYLKGAAVVKYCRFFVPNSADWIVQDWYELDNVTYPPIGPFDDLKK